MGAMGNTLIIAKKEFQDLMNSKLVLIVLGLFILIALVSLYDAITFDYAGVNKNLFEPYDVFNVSLNSIFNVLTYFGCFIAIVIGFSCIASERRNNALNVLTVKPLYRDTIINGKIVGTLCFLVFIYGVTVLLFTSSFFMLYGSVLESNIDDYLARLMLVFAISIIYSLVYVTLSMMIALLVKSQALALVLSMMAIVVINDINSTTFAGYIGLIANGLFGMNPDAVDNLVHYLSPSWLITMVYLSTPSSSFTLSGIFSQAYGYLFALILYLILSTIISYIIFVRSDVR